MTKKTIFKNIKSKNFILRSAGERAAINTPIQGSAADIIKIAMIHIHNDSKLNKYCRLIMQVHDELIFEVDKNKRHMETAVELKVPLSVDIGRAVHGPKHIKNNFFISISLASAQSATFKELVKSQAEITPNISIFIKNLSTSNCFISC